MIKKIQVSIPKPFHQVMCVFLIFFLYISRKQNIRAELQTQMDENNSLRQALEVKKNEYQAMKVRQEEERKRRQEEEFRLKREAEQKRKKEEEERKQKEREMEGGWRYFREIRLFYETY